MTRPSPHLKMMRTPVDWELFRFPGESELRREVENLADLRESLVAWTDPRRLVSRMPPEFPWGGLIAGPSTVPAIHRVVMLLKRTLQLRDELEVHVFPHARWFVDLLPHRDTGVLRLGVSSFTVERLWLREALFAFGRCLGRLFLRQVPLRADPAGGLEGTSRETLLARGLWRFQELGCDRVGMLCCQDASIAARAMLKAATGLPHTLLHADLDEILHERIAEEEAMVGHREHDFTMLRIASLLRFADSDLYFHAFEIEPSVPHDAIDDWVAVTDLDEATIEPAASPVLRNDAIAESREFNEPASREPDAAAVSTLDSEQPEMTILRPFERATPTESHPEVTPTKDNDAAAMANISSDAESFGAPAPKDGSEKAPAESVIQDLPEQDKEDGRRDLRTFSLHAALWIVSLSEEISDAQRDALESTYGPEFLAEIKPAYEREGEAVFESTARRLAPAVAKCDDETKRWLLRDLVQIASADGRPHDDALSLLRDLSSMLAIPAGELSMLTAEFLDPEFADYHFDVGQAVEVLLDGQWVGGIVRQVDDTGDLKIEFPQENETLKFNPTADLVRPADLKQAS